jgi:hypothetical protein
MLVEMHFVALMGLGGLATDGGLHFMFSLA